ncbi:MAG TPA: urate hydroxylase PuuD [Vitreimonas sp.]|uniref:urate hydroxylase PuuD n=1 Tax=Vitreimonas sp. TaxID=3069702 RepID=UPI002D5235BC|nr:urate hydroxylase PuuD [Vitreimonas sp.]HYD88393.1 urate hydroxylase PuuD [Vitreimonas sp.]
MASFLSNLKYVAWTALAVAALFLIYFAVVEARIPFDDSRFWEAALRWGHVLVGIMWIGHLYYFNFTQIPNAPKIPEEHRGPSIGKVIAPAALYWFRWGAMLTLITGLLLAWNQNYLIEALSLGALDQPSFAAPKTILIGIGMWLAIIMWFNVWFIIWPNQQKALNIANAYPDLDAAAKASAAKTAMLFSRTNTFLSAPMLVAMTGASTLFG